MLQKGYGASLIGKSHTKTNQPNQDSYLISTKKKYSLSVVCDGLGSKEYSHLGSKTLCETINKYAYKSFKKKNFDIDNLISLLQEKWEESLFPLSSVVADTTCIFTIITKRKIIMCQIGDGLCAIKINDEIELLPTPQREFSNETLTFGKSQPSDWAIKIIDRKKDSKYSILMCTDGISEDLKMDFLGEFIEELSNSINKKDKSKDNQFLLEILNNWPNKYSNDDKTMVVIK